MTKRGEDGQVLLIIIMLLATAITVVLSTSFTGVTNTQLTKLEEESQKTLAAAEAGIDTALKQGAVADIGTLPGLSEFSGTAAVVETYDKSVFLTPLIQKDEHYTFYLSDYPSLANPYTGGTLTVYYGSEAEDCGDIALEFTLIYGASSSYSIKRYIADFGDKLASNTQDIYGGSATGDPAKEGVKFKCKTDSTTLNLGATHANPRVLIVRALFAKTKLVIEGGGLTPVSTLKPQGKTITSEAKSSTGVVKKVELFQSYPQIPPDFFITSL